LTLIGGFSAFKVAAHHLTLSSAHVSAHRRGAQRSARRGNSADAIGPPRLWRFLRGDIWWRLRLCNKQLLPQQTKAAAATTLFSEDHNIASFEIYFEKLAALNIRRTADLNILLRSTQLT